jgi:nicotinate-nucleotide pyrophosphorylase (carboxylating)
MLDQIIKFALKEDIGEADHSTLACVPKEAIGSAKLLIKEPGIIAGVEVAKRIYELYDPSLKITQLKKDGDRVEVGDIAFTVSGFSQSILTTERLVLNFMQRMSGIATLTSKIVGYEKNNTWNSLSRKMGG